MPNFRITISNTDQKYMYCCNSRCNTRNFCNLNSLLAFQVGAVLIGFDPFISYPKLVKAASYLKNPETLFISTNKDETSPYTRDFIVPGMH